MQQQQVKNICPIWNDEFDLPDGSYLILEIQDYLNLLSKTMKL